MRRDAPYAPYDQVTVKVPLETQGDIASRFWVRYKEIKAGFKTDRSIYRANSLRAILLTEWKTPQAGSEGLGIVEGWRGEIISLHSF